MSTNSSRTLLAGAALSCLVASTTLADEPTGARVGAHDLAGLDALSVDASDDFAGISVEEATQRVIVNVTSSGYVNALRRLQERVRQPPRVHADGMLAVEYRVVARSQAALDRIHESIKRDQSWAKRVGGEIREWGVDPVHNSVRVGVAEITPELELSARQTFGDAVELFEAQLGERTANRETDSRPFYGGIVVNDTVVKCTNGFMIFNTANPSETATSTAGHCFSANSQVYNAGVFVGTVVWRILDSRGLDIEFIRNGSYSPRIYSGTPFGPGSDKNIPVKVDDVSIVGMQACNGGAVSGETCGFRIAARNQCKTFTTEETGSGTPVVQASCSLVRAEKSGDGIFIRKGDSGGPVYSIWTIDGQRAAGALGSVVGREGEKVMFYHDTTNYVPTGWRVKLQ